MEAASRSPQYSVEGVHQDLDGVALDVVARPLCRVSLGHEFVQQFGENSRPARESGAVRRHDYVFVCGALLGIGSDEVQRVDLERAYQAGIEALEIEDHHVSVEAGKR